MRSRAHQRSVDRSAVVLAVVLTLASPTRAAAAPRTALFAISIGYNQSPEQHLRTLKYADDDAVRNGQLMKLLGAQTALLVHLDRESQSLYPKLATVTPTKQALFDALAQLNRRIDEARRQGRKTIFYLFYSGHGDVHQGEGYVQLHGARLTRTDLLRLLRESRAHSNHVVVDACKSYFLVFRRGAGGKRRPASGHFLPREQDIPKNTGFLLSTSSAQDSHEWEAFQAGIFSHEVRSALHGAADANSDGMVTYEETAAFVYTANRSVPNQRYRPRFLTRPRTGSASADAVLVDLRDIPGRRIVFGPELRRRFFVEDRWGTRLADLHPGDKGVSLLVPAAGTLYVRDPQAALEYPIAAQRRVIALATLTPRPTTSRARGAEHESFRRLFRRPFGPEAIVAYRARPDETIDDLPATPQPRAAWPGWTLGLLSAAALTTGGIFTGWAVRERDQVDENTSNAARQQANQTIRRNNAIAVTAYAVSAAALAGYLLWRFWPRARTRIPISSGAGGALVVGGSTGLQVRW